MALEVVHGESRNRTAGRALAERLSGIVGAGTLYLGYPVLATADERVEVDALLVSQEHGLVAFLIADNIPSSADEMAEATAEQDRLYTVLEGYLSRHEGASVPPLSGGYPRHRNAVRRHGAPRVGEHRR
jgi:hypothetical protein